MKSLLLAGSALALVPTLASAQTQIDQGPYDEIVVTAQKRDQSITEVPAAITALNQEDLDSLGVQQFDDLADFIPGLEVQEQSANNPGFVVRGLTSDSGGSNIEPRVSIYQDGVANSRSRGSFVEVFDTNVEVLRGPQPTLFGRSALIGAISLNSIRPDADAGVHGYSRVGYGNLDFKFAEGAVNIPVTDNLAVRLAGRFKEREGYIDSTEGEDAFQGYQTSAVRGSILWEPTDRLTAFYVANYQYDNNPGTSFKSGTFRPAGGSTDPFEAAGLNFFGGTFSEGKDELGLERHLFNATLEVEYELTDALSLTSITAFRKFDSDEVFDPDGFQYDLFLFAEDAEGEQISQELRLNYDNGGRIAGFVGVNYFDETGEQRVPLRYDETIVQGLLGGFLFTAPPGVEQDPTPLAFFPPVNANPNSPLAGAPLGIFEEVTTNFSDSQTFEIFADATVDVTDRLALTGGLRYTYDDKEVGQVFFIPEGQGSALTGAGIFLGGAVLNDNGLGFRSGDDIAFASDEFDGWTGRFAANYEVSDDLTVFANYARGRRPEVLNFGGAAGSIIGIPESEFEVIDAETVDSFEVGGKGRFFDGALQADASFYYYDYTNFQTSVMVGVGQFETVNAGGATAYGFEGTFVATLHENLSVFGNYAWNDATFDDESDDGQQQQFGGNRFRLSPEHAVTVGLNASYESQYGSFAVRPIYSYRTEIFFDNDNDRSDLQGGDLFVDETQDAFGVLDIRATWTSVDGRYTVEVFGENVLDEEYLLDAGNTGDAFGIPTFIAAAPATYGVYLSAQF